jgi:hypothetical protein
MPPGAPLQNDAQRAAAKTAHAEAQFPGAAADPSPTARPDYAGWPHIDQTVQPGQNADPHNTGHTTN